MNFTANLSRQDVELLIREHVAKAIPGHEIESVTFNVRTEAGWRGESCGHTLSSVDVKLKAKPAVSQFGIPIGQPGKMLFASDMPTAKAGG